MTNEEKKIKQLFGNDNHFQVPEGYFDNLADQIMKNIPEQEITEFGMDVDEKFGDTHRTAVKVSLWHRLSLRRIAASVAAVAVLGAGVVVGLRHGAQQHVQMAHIDSPTTSEDDEFDQMADYAMMDSQDIYASLIAEN